MRITCIPSSRVYLVDGPLVVPQMLKGREEHQHVRCGVDRSITTHHEPACPYPNRPASRKHRISECRKRIQTPDHTDKGGNVHPGANLACMASRRWCGRRVKVYNNQRQGMEFIPMGSKLASPSMRPMYCRGKRASHRDYECQSHGHGCISTSRTWASDETCTQMVTM